MITPALTFNFPETLVELAVILLVVLVLRQTLRFGIRKIVQLSTKRSEDRLGNLGTRAASVIAKAGGIASERQAQRARTLGSVLSSIVDIVLVIVLIITLLQTLGISIVPALASAGIGGLAIGFGAQSLVKDFISGIFLIFEDQYGVGDWITVNGVSGEVQEVGFRTTRLQDGNGEIWYLRNGEISKVGNQSQGWTSSLIQLPVNIAEDPFRVMTILEEICQALDEEPEWREQMLDSPTVLGLSSFDARTMTFAVLTKCPGNEQWAVEREVRARAVTMFQRAGIKAPSEIVETAPFEPRPPADESVRRAAPAGSSLLPDDAIGKDASEVDRSVAPVSKPGDHPRADPAYKDQPDEDLNTDR